MDKCPNCGEELTFEEVDIGVSTIRGNPGCENCHWTPDVAIGDKCPYGYFQLHCWSLADGTQCEFCLKFKPETQEMIDYGSSN